MPRPAATVRHRATALACALVGLAACAGVVELRGVDVAARGRGGATAADTARRTLGTPADRPDAARAPGAAERRVCRGERPSGWIAVAYLPSDECPRRAGGDATAAAAVIVPLAGRPVGAVLDVCADERVPRDWQAEARDVADAAGRCPGAARNGASAVMRIRRVR